MAGEVAFGQFCVRLDPARRPSESSSERVILGIRPEAFEDVAYAAPELPTIEVEVVVLEELGSDAHVFFRVDATRIATGALEDEETTPLTSSSTAARCSTPESIRARPLRSAGRSTWRSIPPGSISSTRRRARHSCGWAPRSATRVDRGLTPSWY